MLGLLFNNSENSDYQIKDTKGNIIYLHKLVLKNSSNHFKIQFNGVWKDEKELIVDSINQYIPVMKYFYTGSLKLDSKDLSIRDLNELILYC